MAIDIYAAGKKERHQIWMNDKADTISFNVTTKPDLVNVDGDKVLLAQQTNHKSLSECVFQYFHAPLYLDRFEAIDSAVANQGDPTLKRY